MPPTRDLVYVGVQAALLVALAFDVDVGWRPLRGWPIVGWSLCVMSAGFGAVALLQLGGARTPWPTPRASSGLVTSGVYALARHPIYAAVIAFAIGSSVATGSPWRGLVAAALAALFWRKAEYEERLLRARFPQYAEYARRTPRFGL